MQKRNEYNSPFELKEVSNKQTTLRSEFTFNGIGIFSGIEVGFTAKPNDPGTGIIFRSGTEEIPANIHYVEEADNRTILRKNDIRVQVVEHLVSALHGMGVDNALIEVDSGEIPILDASSKDYVAAINSAGIVEQEESRTVMVVKKPLILQDDNICIGLFPDITPRITYYLDHVHPHIGQISDSMVLIPENYGKFIGPARTFATSEEAEYLIKNGIVGTDDQNLAIVVGPDGPNKELREPKEYVHHKMLDMIGDISLAYWPVVGHMIGIRSGHIMNRKLAREINRYLN